jgi:hypothetical protein
MIDGVTARSFGLRILFAIGCAAAVGLVGYFIVRVVAGHR